MPPRRILIAPNAFKGTLTSQQAADCIERGLKKALPRLQTIKIPVADGGDGTAAAIALATGGRLLRHKTHDPLGRPIFGKWGLTGDPAPHTTAIVDMAQASGLALLKPRERNPLRTTTFGTGELIRAALDQRVSKILIGIGGSATNDGGTGIARALGVRFLDSRGRELPPGGSALARLAHIDMANLDPRLKKVTLEVACDVDNPLYGPRGAAHIYAPQKGASPAAVHILDHALRRLAQVIRKDLGINVAHIPGAGAAGGTGAGLIAFLGAKLRPGIDIVIEATDLRKKLAGCDLAITGEGRLDAQTAHGKGPAGIAKIARELAIPAIAICGCISSEKNTHRLGFQAIFSALEEPLPENLLKARAPAMLERCAYNVAKLLSL